MHSSRPGVLRYVWAWVLASACAHAPPAVVPPPPAAPVAVSEPQPEPPPALPEALRPGEHERILNGVRLYYRVAGEGPAHAAPVLFLHGGPGYNSYSFARLMGTRLEKTRRMVYLDQRGCGRSERPWNGGYSLEVLLADLEALHAELGVERWVLMGHSFGATLALEYAARHPEHMAGIVYVSGLSDAARSYATWKNELERLHPGRLASVALPKGSSDYAQVMRALRGLNAQEFFDTLQFHDATYRQAQQAVDAESGLRNTGELSRTLFSTELVDYRFSAPERVTTPVLVVGGRYDSAIGRESLLELAGALPQATFLEYERSGHFPYLEEADRFEQDVTHFLSGLP